MWCAISILAIGLVVKIKFCKSYRFFVPFLNMLRIFLVFVYTVQGSLRYSLITLRNPILLLLSHSLIVIPFSYCYPILLLLSHSLIVIPFSYCYPILLLLSHSLIVIPFSYCYPILLLLSHSLIVIPFSYCSNNSIRTRFFIFYYNRGTGHKLANMGK